MLWAYFLIVSMLPANLDAEGVRRLQTVGPGIRPRVVSNCTNDCEFCAEAYTIRWANRLVGAVSWMTMTHVRVIDPDDGSTSTATILDGSDTKGLDQLSAYTNLNPAGTHTSFVEALGITLTYPSPVVVFGKDYFWKGTLLTDNVCAKSTDTTAAVQAPAATPLAGAALSTVALSAGAGQAVYTDTAGFFFDLTFGGDDLSFDNQLGKYFRDGAFKSCAPACTDFGIFGYLGPAIELTSNPPQLSTAFATVCAISTKGVDGVEKLADCTAVKGTNPEPSVAPTVAGGSGSSGEQPHTTTDPNGNTVIVAGPSPSSDQERHTTTDSGGSTVIVAGPAPSDGGGSEITTITDEHGSTIVIDGGGGGYLYTSANAQGQTVIATGAPSAGPPGGQITLTNSDGSTIVIQGASLESPGAGTGEGITVTDAEGSTMVVQGGETGTLSVGPDGVTTLLASTFTQTSWVPGATITGGASATEGEGAQATVQSQAGISRLTCSLTGLGRLSSVMAMIVMLL